LTPRGLQPPDLVTNIWTNLGETPGNALMTTATAMWTMCTATTSTTTTATPWTTTITHPLLRTIGARQQQSRVVVSVGGANHGVKFLGPFGGSTADAISSVQYATRMGADVMNNSWARATVRRSRMPLMRPAPPASSSRGAGNSGPTTTSFPNIPRATPPQHHCLMSTITTTSFRLLLLWVELGRCGRAR